MYSVSKDKATRENFQEVLNEFNSLTLYQEYENEVDMAAYTKEVTFIKRETKTWGEVWQTKGSYPLDVCDKIQMAISKVVRPKEWFTYEPPMTNRFADRRVSFTLNDSTDEAMLMFNEKLGVFNLE